MLTVDPLTPEDINQLLDARDPASVTIYLESSPVPAQQEGARIALRNAAGEAEKELVAGGCAPKEAAAVVAPVRELSERLSFWEHQGASIALFAAAGELRTFRMASRLRPHVATGDRFDVGALLRAVTFRNGAHLLAVAAHDVKLYELTADRRAEEVHLDLDLDELSATLAVTDNEGQADRRAAPSDRTQRERFAGLVQRAVLPTLRRTGLPLVITGAPDLVAAYRTVNEYDQLLEDGLDVHPSSLEVDDVDARTREVLDAHYSHELAGWRELFGTRRSAGRATTDLTEVAKAATMGAVEELWFDMDVAQEGRLAEDGEPELVDEGGPDTYNVVDEIAARVLRAGGTVRAVREKDLLDESPVAAVLRFPKESAGL